MKSGQNAIGRFVTFETFQKSSEIFLPSSEKTSSQLNLFNRRSQHQNWIVYVSKWGKRPPSLFS